MKKALKIVLFTSLGIVLLIAITYGIAHLFTSKSQFARAVAWLDSDAQDYKRFPKREIATATPTFYFKQAESDSPYVAFLDEGQIVHNGEQVNLDSFLEQNDTTSFLVIKDDVLLYEKYYNGSQADSIQTSFSAAKSFVSALVGIAHDEGYIESVDDPITKYIPELLDNDPRFADITIRNLISMSSGIRYVELGLPWSDDSTTYYAPDLREAALSTEIHQAPGEEFHYNNYNLLLTGMILERATGQRVAKYMESKIWKPLGMEYPASWSLDSEESNFEKMESGINARAIDYAKFGRLFLNRGNWDGEQIISESWVDESTRADTTTDPAWFYQYYWWVTTSDNPEHHYVIENEEYADYADVDPLESANYHFTAAGKYGQYVFVLPEYNMIIVRTGTSYGDVNWFEFLEDVGKQIGGIEQAG